jgi:hypothetical protein
MSDHVTEWLGAYADDELHGAQRRRVEAHLAGCAACQAELEALRRLSGLLQEPAADASLLPPDRFSANLLLRLPRRDANSQPGRLPHRHPGRLRLAWSLAPLVLLAAWAFVEITLGISALFSAAANLGWLDGNLAWLEGRQVQMGWLTAAMTVWDGPAGQPLWALLSSLSDIQVSLIQQAARLAPLAVLALLYLGWLVAWFLAGQPAQNGTTENQSLS